MNRNQLWILIYEKAKLDLGCYRILQYNYILNLAFINKNFVTIIYILNQGTILLFILEAMFIACIEIILNYFQFKKLRNERK